MWRGRATLRPYNYPLMSESLISTKRCRKCGHTKYVEYFYKQNGKKDGHASYCKLCSREHARKYITDAKRAKWRSNSRMLAPRYSATRRSAEARKIEFSLSIEDYDGLIKDALCHYCTGALPETRGGLDRKDTKGPYSVDNCVPCCVECNRIKGCALSYTEMLAVAKLLKELRGKDT